MLSTGTQPHRSVLDVDGERLSVRPLERSDRDGLAALFERLGPESRYRRFHGPKVALGQRELGYLSDVDHHRHEAFTVVDNRDGRLLGVSRYIVRADDPAVADLAVEVADDVQGLGIGTLLARLLVERAHAVGLDRLEATTLWSNTPARSLMRRLGFRAHASHKSVLELALPLAPRRTP
jgi:RimJ/RimL family protein N-acetyltransferase